MPPRPSRPRDGPWNLGSSLVFARLPFLHDLDDLKLLRYKDSSTMRCALRLLATPTAAGAANGLKPAPLALLPPIPLYRRLLRGHRKHLPHQMRVLGDEYVKSEFRAHRTADNPMHIVRLPPESSSGTMFKV